MGVARHVPGCDCDCASDGGTVNCGTCGVNTDDVLYDWEYKYYDAVNYAPPQLNTLTASGTMQVITGPLLRIAGYNLVPVGGKWWVTAQHTFTVEELVLGQDRFTARLCFGFVDSSGVLGEVPPPRGPNPGACRFVAGWNGGFTSSAGVPTLSTDIFTAWYPLSTAFKPEPTYRYPCQSSPISVEFLSEGFYYVDGFTPYDTIPYMRLTVTQ